MTRLPFQVIREEEHSSDSIVSENKQVAPHSPSPSHLETQTHAENTQAQRKRCAPTKRYFGCAGPNPQCQQGEWIAGVCLVPGRGQHWAQLPHRARAQAN